MNKKAIVGLLIAVFSSVTAFAAVDDPGAQPLDTRRTITMINDKAMSYQALYEHLKETREPMTFFDEIDEILIIQERQLNIKMQIEMSELIKTRAVQSEWKNRLTDWCTEEGEWRKNYIEQIVKRLIDLRTKIRTLAIMHETIANARTATMLSIAIGESDAPAELLKLTICLSNFKED